MPLQNRVTPFGNIVAVESRGTMLGNRGGKFHRDDKTLGRRRWASHHWIACELHYKGMQHEAMGKGYTSLFFLDEVTALAAGHRPCFFCRRAEAKRFMQLAGMAADPFDRLLHEERRNPPLPQGEGALPDGTMVASGDHVMTEHAETWTWEEGVSITLRFTSVQEVRDGLVHRWWDYLDFSGLMAAAPQWWLDHIAPGYK